MSALKITPSQSSTLFFFAIMSINCVYQGEILFTLAEETCESHDDCGSNFVCCKSWPQAPYYNSSNTKRCLHKLDTDGTDRSRYRSCYRFSCSSDDDCLGRRHGKKLCCQNNRCRKCRSCHRNSDCGPSKYCCRKALFRAYTVPFNTYTRCGSSCFGEYCTSHDDCGNDCCRSQTCVKCSGQFPYCKDHSECRYGQFCCGSDRTKWYTSWYTGRQCKDDCTGEFCDSYKDCGSGECCKSNKCFKCPKCYGNSQCESGKYCCVSLRMEDAACDTSCLSYDCNSDYDCGPPDECCISKKCVKCGNLCNSKSDCFNSSICCKGQSYSDSKCGSDCIGKLCISNNDCGQSGVWCDYGECSRTKTCNSTSDCGLMNNKQYYCCIGYSSTSPRKCQEDCHSYPCHSDSDCGAPDECCSSENFCTLQSSKCPKSSTSATWWIIALTISIFSFLAMALIVCLCRHSRKRRQQGVTPQPSNQDTGYSCNNSERMQNNGQLPIGSLGSSNPRLNGVSLPPQEGVLNPPYAPANNEYALNGIQHRDEPNRHPPTYSLSDPLGPPNNEIHLTTMENPNMPPPPYSINYYYFRNDPPPSYEE